MEAGLPLAGVRVVETATGVAGPYLTKILGDLGAEVTKVEPEGGDRSRLHGPFPDDRTDPDRSALFIHLNGAKVLAPPSDLETLVPRADLIVDDGVLDHAGIRGRHPHVVVASMTPFGADGPYAEYQVADIVLYGLGGPMIQTGVREREPYKVAGNQVLYQWGATGAVGVLGALRRAEATGIGALVEVCGLETQLGSIDRQISHLLWRQWTGLEVTREQGGSSALLPSGYFPCLGGHVALIVVANWLPRLLAVLDDPELTQRCSQPDWASDPEVPGLLEAGLYVWLAERTPQQAMADAAVHRLPIAPFNGPAELHRDPHFEARRFFIDRGGDQVPAPPLRFHPAPVVELDDVSEKQGEPDPESLPLAGIRILDLTEVWSGPYATMMLGDLGAEIIRVDNPWFFPTITRGSFPRPARDLLENIGQYTACYPDMEPGERPWNRSGNYVAHSRSKKSCTLDLRRPLGHETFLRLVEEADVVIENGSIGVVDRLDIGWDVLRARNPRLIMVRMPAMGLTGPYRDFVGFGMHLEALGGSASLSGYRNGDPSDNSPTYPMDAAAGAHAAVGVLAALRQRETTGRGMLVEVPQLEVILQHVGELLIDAGWRGENRQNPGNRHVTYAPQGCYPCSGVDQWLVLSVDSDEAWAGMRRAMGEPAWADDERFATNDDRRVNHDELDEYISEWSGQSEASELFHRLQAEGVAAAPVQNQAAQLADPHLAARGSFRINSSVEVPPTSMPGHLWRWDGPALAWGPFNRLGDHNDYVFRDIVGLTDEEYATLDAEGHLSLDYLDEHGNPF